MLWKLACSDLRKDRKVSFCVAVSIFAVVCPLMLLYSLRVGILQGIEDNLVNDPQNLEIRMIGNSSLNDDFFAWLGSDRRVSFSAPLTRSLSAVADLRERRGSSRAPRCSRPEMAILFSVTFLSQSVSMRQSSARRPPRISARRQATL